jgi:hypothetical protein
VTERLLVEPAPGPLENYAQGFSVLSLARGLDAGAFVAISKGSCFRPSANKTLTALANTEPLKGSTA